MFPKPYLHGNPLSSILLFMMTISSSSWQMADSCPA
jgi:hypothetical protein